MAESTSSTAQTERAGGQPELKRVMGPKLLLLFIVGDILGTGIYAVTGNVAKEVGGVVWLPFLVAFVVATITAFSYLELVTKYPQAAGAALYTHKAFGVHFFTFLVCFTVMCSGITSASTASRAFGANFAAFTGVVRGEGADIDVSPGLILFLALIFMTLVALINLRGVAESVKANIVLTCVELSGLLIVIFVGVFAVTEGKADFSRVVMFDTPEDKSIFIAVTAGTSLAFFAMVGFEDSVNMAEETVDPPTTFPRAMLVAMAVTATIYLVVALIASTLVPSAQLAEAESGALLRVVQTASPAFPAVVFAAITLFAVTNTALINMMMASRLLYGMANERIIPNVFGKVHPNRRTPWFAIVVTSGLAVVLVLLLELSELGSMTSLLLLVVFTIVNIAVLVLRRETADHPHFRAPAGIPVVAAVLCAFLASPFSGRPPKEYLFAAILIGLGVLLWAINRAVVGKVDEFDPSRLGK